MTTNETKRVEENSEIDESGKRITSQPDPLNANPEPLIAQAAGGTDQTISTLANEGGSKSEGDLSEQAFQNARI